MSTPLLKVERATRWFGAVCALDDVSISLATGETLGIVGESGSGKSTLGRAIAGLQSLHHGVMRLDDQPLAPLAARRSSTVRGRIQMVFQDPTASLNPRHRVGRILEEPLIVQRRGNRAERQERVAWAMAKVGLPMAMARRYPAEFSGGQRQRISIARALVLAPDIVICDEAVSGLDVSIRAQILNLLHDLRQELGLACLFISHDLAVVRHMADRIVVLYRGRLVESGPVAPFWQEPLHPYSRLLMQAIPSLNHVGKMRHSFSSLSQGNDPLPIGCAFRLQCPQATDLCRQAVPPLRQLAGGRAVACHHITI